MTVGPFLDVVGDKCVRAKFDLFVACRVEKRTHVTRYELVEAPSDNNGGNLYIAPLRNPAISEYDAEADLATQPTLTLKISPLYSFTLSGVAHPDTYFTSMVSSERSAIGAITVIDRAQRRVGYRDNQSTAIYTIPVCPTLSQDDGIQLVRELGMWHALTPKLDVGREERFWSVCWTSGRMVGCEKTRCVIMSLL